MEESGRFGRKITESYNRQIITGRFDKTCFTWKQDPAEISPGKRICSRWVLKSNSAILPSVDLNASYIRLEEVSSLGSIQIGDVHNYSADLTVTQPFFAGGAIPAKLNSAKLARLLSDQTVRAAVQDVIFETARDYYDVLLNQQLYAITVDAVRSANASLDAVQQKRVAGVASDFDVLRAQVELSNFKAEEISNRNAISLSNGI